MTGVQTCALPICFPVTIHAEKSIKTCCTSSAKANDMRAAGLNALLGDVSASGNVGSGGAATAAESAQMMPTDYSFIGDAANHGLTAYNTTRSVDASVALQKSQENVNKSIEGVNLAQKGLMESQTDMQKMTYKFAMDTYQNRLLQEQFKAELASYQALPELSLIAHGAL